MRISSINFNSPVNFTSKNKEIKKADDLMRKSKLAFPYIGNTYIDKFYGSVNHPSSKYHDAAKRLRCIIYGRTCAARSSKNYEEDMLIKQRMYDDAAKDYFLVGFEKTRNAPEYSHQRHKGNCDEASRAALASLYANGFYNSNLANIFYVACAENKKTGEVTVQQEKRIDHVLVLTDMGSGDKNIVIDPWLGFADSKSAAIGKYKEIFYDEELKELEEDAKSAFKRNLIIRGVEDDKNNYCFKSGFVFRTKPTHKNEAQRKEAGYQYRTSYPELLLNKTK